MKIIFLKDVKGQGKKDDIKEVKTGFGEFLIKSGSAVAFTQKSLEILKHQKETRQNEEDKIKNQAELLKQKLDRISLKFKVKTGVQDKVFGNISSKQISEELNKLGYKIDKKKIVINIPLNSLGVYNVSVILHKDVSANIEVVLTK